MPFNFLELPQEVQDFIYADVIECHEMIVGSRTRTPTTPDEIVIGVSGVPSLAIELVCHKFNKDVKQLRSQLWPRELQFHVGSHSKKVFEQVGMDDKYNWLHRHIQHITVTDPSMLEPREKYKFHNLRHFQVHGYDGWLLWKSDPSPENLREILRKRKDLWMTFACHHRVDAEIWSGGCQQNIDVTLVEDFELEEESDLFLEVWMKFKYTRDQSNLLQPRLVALRSAIDGKEIIAEHNDQEGVEL